MIVAYLAFIALSTADDAAGRAAARESLGLTRGSFLDESGQPLVWTGTDGTRHYAFSDLPLSVGYHTPSGRWTRLEGTYNATLSATRSRNDWRTFFLHLAGHSTRGADVRLTLDMRIQAAAERALGHRWGAILALDPRTGAVLAIVSRPACPPIALRSATGLSACRRQTSHPLSNRATNQLHVPGSTFKIVTLSAALDTRAFSLNSLFSGAAAFGPSPYFDNSLYPSNVTRSDLTVLTLSQALAFSDNFTFAHIGLTLGARTLLSYARRFYLDRRIPFDYPVATSYIAARQSHPSRSVVAQSSFGAGVDMVTPLQMALISATAAHAGVMMAPHLVGSVQDAAGHTLWSFPVHVLSHVMSARAAAGVTAGMEFVVQHGSGFEAQIPGVRVAGKTGTAVSGGNKPQAWFIAYAPADHPTIAVAVLREYSGEGFQFAAPIARQVIQARLAESHSTGMRKGRVRS